MKLAFRAGGERTAVTPEDARAIVARCEKSLANGGHELHALSLKGRAWNAEAVNILLAADFMQVDRIRGTLRHLDLADIIASILTEEGLLVTETLSKRFEECDLHTISLDDNAMGPRGLIRVTTLLDNCNLRSLSLGNCGLSVESMNILEICLKKDNSRIANVLEHLVLDRNMMGIEGAKKVSDIVKVCSNMKHFSYQGCRPGPAGTRHLAQGLLELTRSCVANNKEVQLTRLDLNDCSFGKDDKDDDEEEAGAFVFLAKVLAECKKLNHLDIGDASCGNEGLEAILNGLSESKASLTYLNVEGTGELGEKGAQLLANYCQAHARTLQDLICRNNELGDAGCCILMEAFLAHNCALQNLHLECNDMEDDSAAAILQCELPHIQYLNLEDNDLPTKLLRERFGDKVTMDENDDEEAKGADDLTGLLASMKV